MGKSHKEPSKPSLKICAAFFINTLKQRTSTKITPENCKILVHRLNELLTYCQSTRETMEQVVRQRIPLAKDYISDTATNAQALGSFNSLQPGCSQHNSALVAFREQIFDHLNSLQTTYQRFLTQEKIDRLETPCQAVTHENVSDTIKQIHKLLDNQAFENYLNKFIPVLRCYEQFADLLATTDYFKGTLALNTGAHRAPTWHSKRIETYNTVKNVVNKLQQDSLARAMQLPSKVALLLRDAVKDMEKIDPQSQLPETKQLQALSNTATQAVTAINQIIRATQQQEESNEDGYCMPNGFGAG